MADESKLELPKLNWSLDNLFFRNKKLKRGSDRIVLSGSENAPQRVSSAPFYLSLEKANKKILWMRCHLEAKTKLSSYILLTELNEKKVIGEYRTKIGPATDNDKTLSLYIPLIGKREKVKLMFHASSKDKKAIFSNCEFYQVVDNRSNKIATFIPEKAKKSKKKDTILFMGGSTLADNGGDYPFPSLFEFLLEHQTPGKYEVVNASLLGATLYDHIANWSQFEAEGENGPYFNHHLKNEYDRDNLKDLRFLKKGLRNIRPEIVVISSMWNDFFIFKLFDLFLKNGANKVELLETGILKRVNQLRSFLKIEKKPPVLLGQDTLENFMKIEYRWLLSVLIEKIKKDVPHSKIVLLTLPYGLNRDGMKNKRNRLIYEIEQSYYFGDKYKGLAQVYFQFVEDIQNSVSRELLDDGTVTRFFDFSKYFHQQTKSLSFTELQELFIFGHDLYHFSPPGNHYLAEMLFQKWTELN